LREIAVELDAAIMVSEYDVVANDGINAGIGHVNAVLGLGIAGYVVGDQQVVIVAGQDAPFPAIIRPAIFDDDSLGVDGSIPNGADPRPGNRSAAGRIQYLKPRDRDIAAAFQVDPIGGIEIAAIDYNPRIRLKRDRGAGRPALGEVPTQAEPRVGAGPDCYRVPGHYGVARVLQRKPRSGARPGVVVIPGGSDEVAVENDPRFQQFQVEAASLYAAHFQRPAFLVRRPTRAAPGYETETRWQPIRHLAPSPFRGGGPFGRTRVRRYSGTFNFGRRGLEN
jgi:hypothetical protein